MCVRWPSSSLGDGAWVSASIRAFRYTWYAATCADQKTLGERVVALQCFNGGLQVRPVNPARSPEQPRWRAGVQSVRLENTCRSLQTVLPETGDSAPSGCKSRRL